MPQAVTELDAAADSSFAIEVERVLSQLRAAASNLLHASPVPVERATDLQRALDVGAAIAWQLYRLATSPDTFGACAFTPRHGSMARLLDAARSRGFAPEAIDAVESAYDDFTRLVKHHAGNRDTFDAMVAPLARSTEGQLELKHRRAAFRGNVQVWGFQASTIYRACICRVAAPGLEDVALIAGFIGIRQLRPMVPIPLMRRKVFVKRDGVLDQVDVSPRGPSLIEEFSTTSPSSVERSGQDDVFSETLALKGVGRAASETCFLTDTVLGAPARSVYSMGLMVTVPCEALIIDLLVPRGLSDAAKVSVGTYGNASNVDSAMAGAEELRIPTRDIAAHLGTSLESLHAPEVARCPELVRHVLRDNGWGESGFDLYRCRVRFPILHTAVSISVPPVMG